MSEIGITFNAKAQAFSRGDLCEVLGTLPNSAEVQVGLRRFVFPCATDARALLKEYRSNLVNYGYAYTTAMVVREELLREDAAHALVEFRHFDHADVLLDTFLTAYFLTRSSCGHWQSKLTELPEAPLGFPEECV